jgi:hypothetical protein
MMRFYVEFNNVPGDFLNSCISILADRESTVIWIHGRRYEFYGELSLNEDITMLLNSHLYDFVEYLNKLIKEGKIDGYKKEGERFEIDKRLAETGSQ